MAFCRPRLFKMPIKKKKDEPKDQSLEKEKEKKIGSVSEKSGLDERWYTGRR